MKPRPGWENVSIFKYPLPACPGLNTVRLPKDSEILSAGFQQAESLVEGQSGRKVLCIWVKVLKVPEQEHEDRDVGVVGTGDAVWPDSEFRFVDTVFEPPFVWHVLERINGP